MQDIFGSVRRSLVLRSSSSARDEGREGSLVEKIGSCLRKSSVGFLSKMQKPPTLEPENAPPIRWRKGELIGCGAYGRVYMGMNLDSGELLAVKEVSIASKSSSKGKAQAHIQELEEEVKLLNNLSHPNIVRYLGTAREEYSLIILLEFVPGGSISSLLEKFGSFPEAVIKTYTKQLLKGLEYLHQNGIIHRDIKGANILVDNRGCIKLADFGASKQVVELATVSGAKSMKGTPYWMAPEVILQTGHSFSADIWSVGCTVIEMATGKPPWSQYKEVAVLLHIGTTKSHPPIPEHLSLEAKDFLLKCLEKEPNLRPSASDLLQHPFVKGEYQDPCSIFPSPNMEHSATLSSAPGSYLKNTRLKNDCNISSLRCSTMHPEELSRPELTWETSKSDDMCQIGINDDLEVEGIVRSDSALMPDPFSKSFNPMSEPFDWQCKFHESPEQIRMNLEDSGASVNGIASSPGVSAEAGDDFTIPCRTPVCGDDDDEVTEFKIRAFLDEKALELKKLQTPLYEEFYNTSNASALPGEAGTVYKEDVTNAFKLSHRSKSPDSPCSREDSGSSASLVDTEKPLSCSSSIDDQVLIEPNSPSTTCSERQRKWKEELDQELERQRKMMRQASVGRKTYSPKDRGLKRPRPQSRFASPGK